MFKRLIDKVRKLFSRKENNPHNIPSFWTILKVAFTPLNGPIEDEKNEKEKKLYRRLMYHQRRSLETDHERDEIEECMRYVYPKMMRRRAKVLSHDFSNFGDVNITRSLKDE